MTAQAKQAILNQGKQRTRGSKYRFAYGLIAPAVLVVVLVYVVPMIQVVYMSLLDLDVATMRQYLRAPFIGVAQYQRILDGLLGRQTPLITGLFQATTNTFWYTFWVEFGTIVLGFIAATALRRRPRWQGIALTIILLPWVVPSPSTGIIWRGIWRQQGGLANQVLVSWLHLADQPISWLLLENARLALIVPSIWRWLPFTTVILLAALHFIPNDLYEAASIDGANDWQKFRYITWPVVLPAVGAIVLFGVIYNFFGFNGYNIGYLMFWSDNFGRYADLVIPMLVRQTFTNNLYGFGAAVAVLIVAVASVLLVLCYRILRAWERT